MKLVFYSQFGELIDLAAYLQNVEGHQVKMFIEDSNYRRIGEGIVPHTAQWWRETGKGCVWVFDGCEHGNLQDWLREHGELVVGGSEAGDELENSRQLAQKWFRDAGFDQPFSANFTSVDEALAFVLKHRDQKWIIKQSGSAPKSLSYKGHFDSSEDMIHHLADLKKSWNEAEYGKVDFDLMEVVTGLEVAASGFWNGEDWLRNSKGKIVGFLNFEEKKECDGDTGQTTGELGTSFFGVTEDNLLFSNILLRKGIASRLLEIGFRGVCDINCIYTTDNRLVALEPTMRFGIPATSYEFIEGLNSPTGELLVALARGMNRKIEIYEGLGMVMCVVAKPFPLEADVEDDATSLGERLWILDQGKPIPDFTDEQRRHVHLANFERVTDEESGGICYKVPTKNGYLYTVTMRGRYVSTLRDNLIHYIKNNTYLPGFKFRTDIGHRVEGLEEKLIAGYVEELV